MPTYRVHDHTGDDLGLLEHAAPNVEPGDVVVFADDREALVTARVEAEPRPLAALLEIAVTERPSKPLGSAATPREPGRGSVAAASRRPFSGVSPVRG